MEELLKGNLVKDENELSAVAQRLLKLQCVFMIEKEVETLKNRGMQREINKYIQNAKIINFHRILLMIVKSFTEKYFTEVKEQLVKVLKNAPNALGGEDVQRGKNILNKCLIQLEKRMFENLFNELDEQPLYYLAIFNIFNLDFVKSEERYKIYFDAKLKVALEEGPNDDKLITVKCINIFELIKYVYYNTIIEAKKTISQRIFKQFLEENALKDIRKWTETENACEKLMKRPSNKKTEKPFENDRLEQDKPLKIVEHLIKEMWNSLPDLKNPVCLKKERFLSQLSQLLSNDDNCNSFYEDEQADEKINWNYMVTRDGETLYLNAPSYKTFEEFRPGLSRVYEYKPTFTEDDLDHFLNPPVKEKCRMPDAFDLKMETILAEGKRLVGDELAIDKKGSKNERILSYVKIRNKFKKRQMITSELWNLFQKKYFTFEENESEEADSKKCVNPIRPQEFYDLIPRLITDTVRPIEMEFASFKYICAACGYFINKGTVGHTFCVNNYFTHTAKAYIEVLGSCNVNYIAVPTLQSQPTPTLTR